MTEQETEQVAVVSPEVEAALAALDTLDNTDPNDLSAHPEAFARVHDHLQRALTAIDDA